jgi:hypothetical protein
MKKAITLFLICIVTINGLAHTKSQGNSSEIAMLRKFYIEYNTAWANSNGNILIKKLDSLKSKYCTKNLRKELQAEFKRVGLDHDQLINDDYTDVAHLNTLNVTKENGKPNGYIVSYTVFTKDASNHPIQENIIVHVTVVKENGSFKIASAK